MCKILCGVGGGRWGEAFLCINSFSLIHMLIISHRYYHQLTDGKTRGLINTFFGAWQEMIQ